MRRAVTWGLAVLLGAGFFPSAFGQEKNAAEAEPRVTLRVYAPPPDSTALYYRGQRAIFDEFVRTHPEIDVQDSQILQMQNVGNGQDLLAIAGGIAPDVMSKYYQQMHSFIEQNFIAPIDEYIDTWERKDIVPKQLWPVVTGRDGKRYGAIYTWPTLYLSYRRDLFEEAGLDPSQGPRDWDELYHYAMKLSWPDMVVETAIDPAAKAGRMGFFMPTSGSWIFSNFVWQAGGDIVQKRPDGKWQAVFDSPEAVRALEFWKKLRWQKWTRCQSPQCAGKNVVYEITDQMLKNGVAKCPDCGEETPMKKLEDDKKLYTGVVRTGYGGTQNVTYDRAFARGEVAMVLMPLIIFQNVLGQNVLRIESIGLAPLPAGPTGIRASIIDGDAYCISSACIGDKAKMDAAWEYIRFMTSDHAEAIETKIYVESGYGRFVRNPHWLEKYGYKEYFNEVDPQLVKAFDEALRYGRPEPYAPGYDAMGLDMNIPVSRIIRDATADPKTELTTVVDRINTHIFKLYPEAERRYKRRIALIIAICVATLLSVAGYFLIKAVAVRVAAAAGGSMSAALRASRWKHVYAWLFLFPAVGTILLWSYIPLVRGSVMSFYDYKIITSSVNPSLFIGLDNFIDAVTQPVFWQSLWRTFFYIALSMSLGFFTPIILALFLAEVPRLKITFRLLFYLPALTSGLVIMFLWKDLFFNPSEGGLLNRIIGFAGVTKQDWLQDPKLAMLCVVLPGVWAGAGPGSIIYLAALKTVPDEMYEAAEMDGAGIFQKVFLVTLPYLKPLILINFLGAFIGSFHATQNIFVMTMGGPEMATHTLSLEIFLNAFVYLKFGYATAMAWIMGSMLVGFTLYQLRIFQRVQFTAGGAA